MPAYFLAMEDVRLKRLLFAGEDLHGTDRFATDVGGRLCQQVGPDLRCCLPCPMTDWVYPHSFNVISAAANWMATISALCCILLLASWAFLPVEKTSRHYLSVCLTVGVLLMNVSVERPQNTHQLLDVFLSS